MRLSRVWLVRWLVCGFLVSGLCGMLGGAGSALRAQTFSEWFSQSKAQKKYLLEQIAALEVYLNYARQGYRIVGSGLEVVHDISNGEFSLHDAFFKGLKLVSPVVKGDARVAETVDLQVSILQALSGLKAVSGFSDLEKAYLASVAGVVMGECLQDLSELFSLVLSSDVDLADAERLIRLQKIYGRMKDRSAFVQKFCGDVDLMLRIKKTEEKSIKNLRRMYEIN